VVAGAVLTLAGETEVLPGIAAGTTRAALALSGGSSSDGRVSGSARFVIDGPSAEVFLVRAGDELLLVRASDAVVTTEPALDQTRSMATVSFAAAPAVALSADRRLGPFAEDLMRALLAVECAGAAERALEVTVEYLKTRSQFGRPIGSFQAIKHKCSDMFLEVESARSAAYAAASEAADDSAELPAAASLAKAYCTDAFFNTAAESIQIHGGIGFTWEHDAHLYFKRAKSSQLLLGDPTYHRELVARQLGI
jgi:alkylation response protein AidB-like acyl-CoA dehydrogenase